MNTQPIIAIVLYLTATILSAFNIRYTESTKIRLFANISGFVALGLHAQLLYAAILLGGALNFGFFNAVALVGWMVPLIVLLTSFYRPLGNLLLILYPIAIITIILLILSNPEQHLLLEPLSVGLHIHILLSVCAYSLLSISTLQALLLALQERMIKTKRADKIMNILPPLQVMENLLIQLLMIGFFLLSLSLASGMMFINDLFAQHLVHKTVLSITAWVIYGIILWGRWVWGWRGGRIIWLVFGGFIALLLAYFGSKFVLELLLQRV